MAKILLVEDEKALCMLYQSELGAEGHEVIVAHDGKTAIQMAADTGCGMEQNIRDEIFAPFYTTKKKGGTGLGLAISQKILIEHGAEVSVETELGRGSTFVVRFPRGNEDAPQDSGA